MKRPCPLSRRNRLKNFRGDSVTGEPVRGLNRRIIVVPSPDRRIFQEAVFVLRDDYTETEGISRRELLLQARACAEEYVSRCIPVRRYALTPAALLLIHLPAAVAAAVLCLRLLGVI